MYKLFIILFVAVSCQQHVKHSLRADINQEPKPFTNGEILLPDYVHDDTLIVVNAIALNKIFHGPDLPVPATDWEIQEVLNRYCVVQNTFSSDYGLEVDSTGYTIWDNDRLVSHFPFEKNPVLDSVIYKDNE